MLIGPMLQRLHATETLEQALDVALADVVALHGAERGNVQLFEPDGSLVLVHQRGFAAEFLRAFARVAPGHGAAGARAAARGEPVHVHDVQVDPAFAPYRALARTVPFRSVISSPLVPPGGQCVGAVSVHFAHPFTPSALEMATLSAYCGHLARCLCERFTAAELRVRAAALSAGLVPSPAPAVAPLQAGCQ